MNRQIMQMLFMRNRTGFMVWLGIVVALTALLMLMFPSMEDMRDGMTEMMKGFPDGMMKAFGMDPDAFGEILGWYSTYYAIHIMLLSGCFSMIVSGSAISIEENEGTADFLLTRPVERKTVVWSKVSAVLIMIFIFHGVQILSAVATMNMVKSTPIDYNAYLVMTAYGVLLNLFFTGLGFFLSLIPRKGRSLTGPLIGVVIGTYIVKALSQISPDTEWIGWISPWKYADFNVMQSGYSLDLFNVIVLGGGFILFTYLTFKVYKRKDISV